MKIKVNNDKRFVQKIKHLIRAYEFETRLQELGLNFLNNNDGEYFLSASDIALSMIFSAPSDEELDIPRWMEICDNKELSVDQKYSLLMGIDNNIEE